MAKTRTSWFWRSFCAMCSVVLKDIYDNQYIFSKYTYLHFMRNMSSRWLLWRHAIATRPWRHFIFDVRVGFLGWSTKRLTDSRQSVLTTQASSQHCSINQQIVVKMERFAAVNETDLDNLLKSKDSDNTKKIVKRSVIMFRDVLGHESCYFESFTNWRKRLTRNSNHSSPQYERKMANLIWKYQRYTV